MHLAIVTLYFREEGNQSGSRRVDVFVSLLRIGRIFAQKHEAREFSLVVGAIEDALSPRAILPREVEIESLPKALDVQILFGAQQNLCVATKKAMRTGD